MIGEERRVELMVDQIVLESGGQILDWVRRLVVRGLSQERGFLRRHLRQIAFSDTRILFWALRELPLEQGPFFLRDHLYGLASFGDRFILCFDDGLRALDGNRLCLLFAV